MATTFRHRICLTLCVLLLLALHSSPAFSKKSMRFRRFTIEDGLSQSTVETIVQDREGYMWFGTEDGLNRFDGYEFKIFRNDPDDPHSISNNNIWCLFVDWDGFMWAGTYSTGLNRYDHETGTFTRYLHDPEDQNSISSNYIRSITQDDSGNMWIGTRTGGVNLLEPGSGKFKRYTYDKDSENSIPSNSVRSIVPDSGGILWIATNRGFCRFDTLNDVFTHYRAGDRTSSSLVQDNVRHILKERSGILWISTSGGLSRFDPESGQFVNYVHDDDDPGSLSLNNLRDVYEDRRGQLYVGTTTGGLCLYDREKQSFTVFRNDPTDPRSLGRNSIRAICEDRSGLLWLGHSGGGLSVYDPVAARFQHYLHDPADPNSLSDTILWAISQGPSGDIWFGTNTGDLDRYYRSTGEYRHYSHIPEKRPDGRKGYIRNLFWDDADMLWLCSSLNGLYRLNPEDDSYILFQNDPDDPNSIGQNQIRSILQDKDGEMWFSTRYGGFDHYDPATGAFTHFRSSPGDPGSISSDQTTRLQQDSKGIFWLGTADGLNRISFSRNTNDPSAAPVSIADISRFYHDPSDPQSLSHSYILAVYEARSGDMWFGTMQGLSRLRKEDRDRPVFAKYFMKDGLPNDVIYSILEDSGGNLWLSTNYGISRFDPEAETFKNFDVRDGLHGNEFNTGTFCSTEEGTFIFGGVDGASEFHPDSLRDSSFNPPVILTGFNIFDKPAELDRSISNTEEITLSYKDNYFSFEFASLDYSKPDRNRFEYILEGLDREWTNAGTRHFAGYTRVDPGKYVFKVRGTNGDGVWSEHLASVRIIITPPFWKTWWFITLVILATASGIAALITYRVKQLLAIERLRSKIAADLHDDIGAGLTEISIMGEIISSKLPPDSKTIVTSEIERIGTTSRHLINSMSDIVWLVNPHRDSLYDLISRLGDSYKETLFACDINFRTQNLESLKNVRLSMEYRQNLFLIFKEAVNNSLKYSGAAEISLNVELSGRKLVMQIVDDGNGFDTGQARDGNGLRNMQERAGKIGGVLRIESASEKGTTIEFRGNL